MERCAQTYEIRGTVTESGAEALPIQAASGETALWKLGIHRDVPATLRRFLQARLDRLRRWHSTQVSKLPT